MFRRGIFSGTVVLSHIEFDWDDAWKDATLVVLLSSVLATPDYKSWSIDKNSDIEVYKTKHGKYYLNQFDEDETLLGKTIDGVVIRSSTVEIYVHGQCLRMFRSQLNFEAQTEFFYKMVEEPISGPQQKKRRIEISASSCSTISEELGISTTMMDDNYKRKHQDEPDRGVPEISVRTVDDYHRENEHDEAQRNDDDRVFFDESGNQRENSSESSESEEEPDSLNISTIPTTSLEQLHPKNHPRMPVYDRKLRRSLEIQTHARVVKSLLDGKLPFATERNVLVSNILEDTSIPKNDAVVERMVHELDEGGILLETDPVIIVKENDYYKVISGKRRIAAVRESGMKKVVVRVVSAENRNEADLKHYFTTKKQKEVASHEMIGIYKKVLVFLGLEAEQVIAWTDKEQASVFGQMFGSQSKAAVLFKISLLPELSVPVCAASVDGQAEYSIRTLKLLHGKFKVNDIGTLSTLRSYAENESELYKSLISLDADLSTILSKKKVKRSIIQRIVEKYGEDADFTAFAKSHDIRLRSNQCDHYELISRQFQKYKETSAVVNTDSVKVVYGEGVGGFQTVISSDKALRNAWLENGDSDSIFVLLGTMENDSSSNHYLSLPTDLGTVNKVGCMQRCLHTSLYIKQNGKIVAPEHASIYFADAGIPFCDVYLLDEFRSLYSGNKSLFVDVRDGVRKDLIFAFCKNSTLITVNEQEEVAKLKKFIAAETSQAS